MIERIEINLLPAEYRVHKRSIKLQREVVYPALAFVGLWLGLWMWSTAREGRITAVTNEITAIEKKIDDNKHIKKEINKLRKDRTVIREKIRALQRISVNKAKWVRLMEILSAELPPFTWLSSVQERGSEDRSMLRMTGSTFSFPEVATLMTGLTGTEYITSVDLANIAQQSGENPSYVFSLTATVNPDVSLDKESD